MIVMVLYLCVLMYMLTMKCLCVMFFFNDTATTEIYTVTHSFPTRRSSDLGCWLIESFHAHPSPPISAHRRHSRAVRPYWALPCLPSYGTCEIGRAHV